MLRFAPSNASPSVRHGFWAAFILGCLNLAGSAVNAIAALTAALVFFAVAWGIRRGRAWAPVAGICCLVPPILVSGFLGYADRPVLVLSLLLDAVLVYFLGRAALSLWSHGGNRGLWPWAPAALLGLLFWVSVHPFRIAAGSMERTLSVGDLVLVEHASWVLGRTPMLQDVVVIRYPPDPKQLFIKRIVAGPGDRIQIKSKKLYRNGDLVDEPYAVHLASNVDPYRDGFPSAPNVQLMGNAQDMLQYHVEHGELTLPEGKYFVMGDNRDNSLDSRYWGFISRHDIVGSPVMVYGPARRPKWIR